VAGEHLLPPGSSLQQLDHSSNFPSSRPHRFPPGWKPDSTASKDARRHGGGVKQAPARIVTRRSGSQPVACAAMSSNAIIDGIIFYLGLIVLLTFHEYGHAWMASKCGDDTAKDQGRCSLNPIVHIDLIGTVLIPLAAIFLSMSQTGKAITPFLVGWAKPVPVNPNNLRNPKLDDILISMAGPWMNLLLAVALMGLARLGLTLQQPSMVEMCMATAFVSLMLCFFNLIPIPPLDGSHVLRVVTGMSRETYFQFARFGILAVIIVLQIPLVRNGLFAITITSWRIIAGWFGVTT